MNIDEAINEAIFLLSLHRDEEPIVSQDHYDSAIKQLERLQRVAEEKEPEPSTTDVEPETTDTPVKKEDTQDESQSVEISPNRCDKCGQQLSAHPVTVEDEEAGVKFNCQGKLKVVKGDEDESELNDDRCKDCGVDLIFADDLAEMVACFECKKGPYCPKCVSYHQSFCGSDRFEVVQ